MASAPEATEAATVNTCNRTKRLPPAIKPNLGDRFRRYHIEPPPPLRIGFDNPSIKKMVRLAKRNEEPKAQ